ncbi:hypothetical protein LTR08_000568 [Meristemomyces frigidus]|nr:hypothetical protein LTR08_000568 [Meristemomyces frigidus]
MPGERKLVAMRPSPTPSGLDLATGQAEGQQAVVASVDVAGNPISMSESMVDPVSPGSHSAAGQPERQEAAVPSTTYTKGPALAHAHPYATEPFPAYVEPRATSPGLFLKHHTPTEVHVRAQPAPSGISTRPSDDRLDLPSQARMVSIPRRLSHRQTLQHVAAVFQPRGRPTVGTAAEAVQDVRSTDASSRSAAGQRAQQRQVYVPYTPGWGIWSEPSSAQAPLARTSAPAPATPNTGPLSCRKNETFAPDGGSDLPYRRESPLPDSGSWYDRIQVQMAAQIAKWGSGDGRPDSIEEGEALAQESEKYVPYVAEPHDTDGDVRTVTPMSDVVEQATSAPQASPQEGCSTNNSGERDGNSARLSRPRQNS